MLFNSYIFIFLFFPICLLGYYGLLCWGKKEAAQLFLLAVSFWFYGYFQVHYLLVMLFDIAVNYCFHRLLSKKPSGRLLFLAIAANLGVLFYFKYYDFFVENLNAVFGSSLLPRHVLLPLGISFFTFQQIGFLADTYRGEVKDCGLLPYALFVAFFPQLIAGPIVTQAEMLPQFQKMAERRFDWEKFARGYALFVLGLFKKVILADMLGAGVDYGYANIALLGRADALIIIVAYSLQLYFDFSGYCDMARGIGRMLGFEIAVNFNSPYRAVNIVDFWKRWHITLNRFFTSYVYIPLGGNRRGRGRMYLNLLFVFFLSGVWHGAGWNFIIWGMLHGALYVLTRWYLEKKKLYKERRSQGNGPGEGRPLWFSIWRKTAALVSKIALFLYVSAAWVYFRAADAAQANRLLRLALQGKMQKVSFDLAECFQLDEFWYVLKMLRLDNFSYSRYVPMVFLLAAGLLSAMFGRNAAQLADGIKGKAYQAVLLGAVFVWCVLSFSQVSVFLYFNF
ncbi:MAG: MBOAT family protein [Blautia sp.]|nr:MBOAT family protein [Blautia sp.]MCM1199618.1 hypothetical protein [Bacteroides fragilis]